MTLLGYVMAVWFMTSSSVMASPGRSVEPQRKPGENAISAPFPSSAVEDQLVERAVMLEESNRSGTLVPEDCGRRAHSLVSVPSRLDKEVSRHDRLQPVATGPDAEMAA